MHSLQTPPSFDLVIRFTGLPEHQPKVSLRNARLSLRTITRRALCRDKHRQIVYSFVYNFINIATNSDLKR